MKDVFATLDALFDRARVDYALIGAHAVNAWIEPRATADVDVTVLGDAADLQRLREVFEAAGYTVAREHGAALASGPDFVRFVSSEHVMTVEIQTAKTELQIELVKRAKRGASGLRVATPEDLIVLKLIAYRPKDCLDLAGLVELEALDWAYVERWARIWRVTDRLAETRSGH